MEKHIFYCPLTTSSFYALIRSEASTETKTRLFAQILEGVKFLHDEGISHRDIKPANLTVESYDPPRAMIVDFGCATYETRILYDRPGTISYLAPEQRQYQYHGCSVDYWACGLVGVQLLGGQEPSRQVTPRELEIYHTFLDEGTRRHFPLALCCRSMLNLSPEARLTAKNALLGVLAGFTDEAQHTGRRMSSHMGNEKRSRQASEVIRMHP